MKHLILCLSILLIFSGCSKVTIEKYDGSDTEGLRFYRPSPYLLITQTKDGASTSIIWLPDKKEEYIVKHRPGFGSSQFSVTLNEGWNLTEIGSTMDSKIPETITAFGALATGFAARISPDELQPGLYEITYNETNGNISGLRRIELIDKNNM